MTWTARARIESVSDGPGPITVQALITSEETYTTQQVTGYETDEHGSHGTQRPVYADVEVPCISSNTEGAILSVAITLELDSDETSLKLGDDIMLTGHFTN